MDIKELIAQFDDMESENGMNIQEAELKDQFVGLGKEIKSDLGFGIGVKDNGNGGIYFGGIIYNNSPNYYPTDHKASKEELKDICERIGLVIEESLNSMEDKIVGILNERGFRANVDVEDI